MMFNGKQMEAAKRKKGDGGGGGAVPGRQKQKKARDEGGNETDDVKEDEVEEFFAILNRMQVAVRYFKNADGGGGKVTNGGSRWRAMLERNEEAVDVNVGPKGEEGVEENVRFDLNAEPDPE